MGNAIDRIRRALGIRKRRRLQPRGPQPARGSKVVKGDLRMEVPDGMSPELWSWLSNLGWRKAMYAYDRRRYRDVPAEWAAELVHVKPAEWDRTLTAAAASARGKGPLPPYRSQAVGWNAPDVNYLSDSDRAV